MQNKTSISIGQRTRQKNKLLLRTGLGGGIVLSAVLLVAFGDNIADQFREKDVSGTVEWANIEVVRLNESLVHLNWATITEEFSRQFTIERSIDRQDVETVAVVLAAEHSREIRTYQYYDMEIDPEKAYYYRFKFMDVEGNEIYSDWVEAAENQEEAPIE